MEFSWVYLYYFSNIEDLMLRKNGHLDFIFQRIFKEINLSLLLKDYSGFI